MKDLDFKLRQRFEQREYYGVTRLEKKEIKRLEAEKKKMQEIQVKAEEIYNINAPIVHGGMKYMCESCGKSWFMCLEIGVEDFGKNGRPHQPCPFCIPCDCGGIATDISGYLPLPQKARLKKGMRYFAYDDSGNEDACGKATIY